MSTKHSRGYGFLDQRTGVKLQVSAFISHASVNAFSQKIGTKVLRLLHPRRDTDPPSRSTPTIQGHIVRVEYGAVQEGTKGKWQTGKRGKILFSHCNWGLYTKNFRKWRPESRTHVFPSQPDAAITMLWIHMFKFNRRSILLPSAEFPGVQSNLLDNKYLSHFNSKKERKQKRKTSQWNLHLWDEGEGKQENEEGTLQTQGLAVGFVRLFPFSLNCWGHQSAASLELIQTLHVMGSPCPNPPKHLQEVR